MKLTTKQLKKMIREELNEYNREEMETKGYAQAGGHGDEYDLGHQMALYGEPLKGDESFELKQGYADGLEAKEKGNVQRQRRSRFLQHDPSQEVSAENPFSLREDDEGK